MAIISGKVWKFGENVDTDEVFYGRHIMGGDETDKEAYKIHILKGTVDSLSSIKQDNVPAIKRESVPDGFIQAAKMVLEGYLTKNEELKNTLSGDIIVAKRNFGIGSSRQQAPEALKFLGISAVLADSIHIIFFRNFWNLGNAGIDYNGISQIFDNGDIAEIDLSNSLIRNISNGKEIPYKIILGKDFLKMYQAGGLIAYSKTR